MARFYIDELRKNGYDSSNDIKADDERHSVWADEREKYGFDGRDTWSLDFTMSEMLYERLNMFLEKADEIVNLSYHTFEFEDNTYTLRDLILMMIEDLKFSLSYEYDSLPEQQISDEEYDRILASEGADEFMTKSIELENSASLRRQRAWKIWAIVSPYMWW